MATTSDLSFMVSRPALYPEFGSTKTTSHSHTFGLSLSLRQGFFLDLLVWTCLAFFGAFQVTHYPRSADFLSDPGYPDLARSLVERGTYELDYLPETTLPPGFSFLLALIGRFFGLTPGSLFPLLAISMTVGLVASYELLRRVEGREIAAISCILLAASPSLFLFNTGVVFPEMPYFCLSILALLIARKLDTSSAGTSILSWTLLLGMVFSAAEMIRSIGIALVVGIGLWMASSFIAGPATGWRRLRRFIVPLGLSLATQFAWSLWADRHQTLEWQLPGYPQSYLSQLAVKDGQEPELGYATVTDVAARVEKNLVTYTVGYVELLTRKHVSRFWASPAIAGVLVLCLLGLANSLRSGSQLYDWYFLCYQIIFLLWPWDIRDRFLFPVVPFFCLYVWRGGRLIIQNLVNRTKLCGGLLFLAGCSFSVASAAFAAHLINFHIDPNHVRSERLQPLVSSVVWAMVAAVGWWAIRRSAHSDLLSRFAPVVYFSARLLAVVAVLIIAALGMKQQLILGAFNLHPDITQTPSYPEIEASDWIRANEPRDRIIMARDQDTVFHYTGQRVIWFPPLSDPKVLMEGIRRHHAQLLVVAHHSESYWRPSEEACFENVERAYKTMFKPIHTGLNYAVFEIAQ